MRYIRRRDVTYARLDASSEEVSQLKGEIDYVSRLVASLRQTQGKWKGSNDVEQIEADCRALRNMELKLEALRKELVKIRGSVRK